MGGTEDELPGALVVEVDEAGIGVERLGHLARDEREHLLEVERRVDGGDRLRSQAEVAGGGVHGSILGGAVRRSLYKLLTAAAEETSRDGNKFSDR